MLWDLNEGKHLYTLDGGDIINALCFSPNRYWLCAATGPSIKIWVSGQPLLGGVEVLGDTPSVLPFTQSAGPGVSLGAIPVSVSPWGTEINSTSATSL